MSYIINAYNRLAIPMIKGIGPYLFDQDKKEYLDFSSGIATTSLGHSHPYITEKLKVQLNSMWHCSNLFTIPQQELLATRLASLTFSDKIFFCSSGLEAVEAAIKFIRRYFYMKGEKKRNRIITIEGGFHGRSIAAISAGGNEKSREGFGPLLSGFDKVPRNNIQALKEKINEETAAIFLEPIQSEGGVYPLNIEYLKQIREITKAQEIILCFDEIQSGYGRIGSLFHYQNIDIEPDMLTCAKAMGNGFPIAACMTKNYIVESITPGTHGSTYGGNPLAMAVGNAVLDIILEEGFFHSVKKTSRYMKERLINLAREFPEKILEIRGEGLLLGMELITPIADQIMNKCINKGLIITKVLNNQVIRITPPLIINNEHIDVACDILYDSFLK